MTTDPKEALTHLSPKQKITAAMVMVVVIVLLWQVIGMFGGGSSSTPTKTNTKNIANGNGGGSSGPAMVQPANFGAQQASPEIQVQIARMQAQTQQQYVTAMNQLQLLKMSQQIADVNKAIASAKLDTVKSEKEIVEMLTKPAPQVESARNYSENLRNPLAAVQGQQPGQLPQIEGVQAPTVATQQAQAASVAAVQPEDSKIASYVVISVSRLMNKWSAVLGYQGRLYSVYVGDVMPVDGSTIKSIDKFSVLLAKGGTEKKISLVPII